MSSIRSEIAVRNNSLRSKKAQSQPQEDQNEDAIPIQIGIIKEITQRQLNKVHQIARSGDRTLSRIVPYFKKRQGQMYLRGLVLCYFATIEPLVHCKDSPELVHIFLKHSGTKLSDFPEELLKWRSCGACKRLLNKQKGKIACFHRMTKRLQAEEEEEGEDSIEGNRVSLTAKSQQGETILEVQVLFYLLNGAPDGLATLNDKGQLQGEDELNLEKLFAMISWADGELKSRSDLPMLSLRKLLQYVRQSDFSWVERYFGGAAADDDQMNQGGVREPTQLTKELRTLLRRHPWNAHYGYRQERNLNWTSVSRKEVNQKVFGIRAPSTSQRVSGASDNVTPQELWFLQTPYNKLTGGRRSRKFELCRDLAEINGRATRTFAPEFSDRLHKMLFERATPTPRQGPLNRRPRYKGLKPRRRSGRRQGYGFARAAAQEEEQQQQQQEEPVEPEQEPDALIMHSEDEENNEEDDESETEESGSDEESDREEREENNPPPVEASNLAEPVQQAAVAAVVAGSSDDSEEDDYEDEDEEGAEEDDYEDEEGEEEQEAKESNQQRPEPAVQNESNSSETRSKNLNAASSNELPNNAKDVEDNDDDAPPDDDNFSQTSSEALDVESDVDVIGNDEEEKGKEAEEEKEDNTKNDDKEEEVDAETANEVGDIVQTSNKKESAAVQNRKKKNAETNNEIDENVQKVDKEVNANVQDSEEDDVKEAEDNNKVDEHVQDSDNEEANVQSGNEEDGEVLDGNKTEDDARFSSESEMDSDELAPLQEVSNEDNGLSENFILSAALPLSSARQQSLLTREPESGSTSKRPLTPTIEQLNDESHCTSKKSKTNTEEMSHLDQENIPAASVSVKTDTSATAEPSSGVNLAPDCLATAFSPAVQPTTTANEPVETEDVESSSYKSSDGNESKVDDNDEAASPHEVSNEVNFAEEFNLSAASSSSSACQQSPSTNPESESTAKRPLTPTVEQLNDESHCISKKSKSKTEKMSHLDQENIPAASVSVETNTSATAEPSSGINLAPDCPATAFSPAVQPTTAANEPVEAEDVESSSYKSSDGNESKVDDIGEAASPHEVSNEVNFAEEFNLSTASLLSSHQQSPSTNAESELTEKRPLTPTVEQLDDENHCTSKKSKTKTEEMSHLDQANIPAASVSVETDTSATAELSSSVNLAPDCPATAFSPAVQPTTAANEPVEAEDVESSSYKSSDGNESKVDDIGEAASTPDVSNEVNFADEFNLSATSSSSSACQQSPSTNPESESTAKRPLTPTVEQLNDESHCTSKKSKKTEKLSHFNQANNLFSSVSVDAEILRKILANVQLRALSQSLKFSAEEENLEEENQKKQQQQPETEKPNQLAIDLPLGSGEFQPDYINAKASDEEEVNTSPPPMEHLKPNEKSISPFLPLSGVAESFCPFDTIVQAVATSPATHVVETTSNPQSTSFLQEQVQQSSYDSFLINPVDRTPDETPKSNTNIVLVLMGAAESSNRDQKEENADDDKTDKVDEDTENEANKRKDNVADKMNEDEKKSDNDNDNEADKMDENEEDKNKDKIDIENDNDDEAENEEDDDDESYKGDEDEEKDDDAEKDDEGPQGDHGQSETDNDDKNDKEGNDNDSDRAESSDQDEPKSENQPKNENSNTEEEMVMDVEERSQEVNTEEQSENSPVLPFDKDNLHAKTDDVFSSIILSTAKTVETEKICLTVPSSAEASTAEPDSDNENDKNGNDNDSDNAGSSYQDVPKSEKQPENKNNTKEEMDINVEQKSPEVNTEEQSENSSILLIDKNNLHLQTNDVLSLLILSVVKTNENKKIRSTLPSFTETITVETLKISETEEKETESLRSSSDDIDVDDTAKPASPKEVSNGVNGFESGDEEDGEVLDGNKTKDDARFSSNSELDIDEPAPLQEVSNEDNLADNFPLPAASAPFSACQQSLSTNEPESESTAKRPLTPTVEQLDDESHCTSKKSETNTEEMSHFNQPNIPAASVSLETDTLTTAELSSSVNLASDCPATAFLPAVHPTTAANEPAEAEEVESSSYKSSDSNESKVDDNDEAASPHEVSNEVNFADEFNLSAASSSSSACQQLPSTNPESESTAKRPLTPTVEQLNDESHCILKKSKTNTEEMSHLDQENIPAASVSVETSTSATTEPLSSVNLAPDCPATAFSPAVQPTTTANEPAQVEEVEPFSMNVEGSSSSAEVTAVISAEVSGLMAKTLEKTFSSNAVDESGDDSSGDGSDDHHHHQAATEEISHEDHQMPEAKNADSHNNNSLLGARSFIRAGEKLPSPADTVVQEVLSADEVQSLELLTASPTDADASSPSSSPKSPPHPPLSSSSPSSHSFIIPSNLSVQPFHPSSPLFSPLPAAPSSSSSCCILQSPSPEFILATESLRSQTTSSSLSSSSSSSSLTSVDPSILGLLSQSPPSPPSSHSLSSHPSSSSPTIPTSSSSPPPTAAPKSPSSSPSFHHSSSSETSHLRPTPPLSSLKVLPVLPSQEQSNSFGNEQDKLKNKSDDENSKKKAQNILENSSNSEFFSEDKSPECELVIVEKAELATSSSSSLVAAETAVPYVYQENTSPVTQESPSEMENFLQNFWETPDEQKSNDNAHITSNDEGIVVANIMPNVASCVASSSTGFQLSPPLTTTTTTTTTAVLSSAHQMNVHLSLENSTEPLKCFQSNFINSAVLPSTTPENNVTNSGCFLEQRNSKNEIVPEAELSSSSSAAALSLKNSVFQQASSPAQAVEGPSDGENLDEPPIEALAIVQNEQVVVNNEEQAKQSAVNEEVDVLNLNSFFAEQSETVETESFEVPVDRGAILHSEYHQQIFESTFSDMNTSHDSLSVSQSTGTTNSEDILGIAVQASGIISYKEQQNNSNVLSLPLQSAVSSASSFHPQYSNYGDSMSSFKHPPPLSTAFQQMPQLETQPQLKQKRKNTAAGAGRKRATKQSKLSLLQNLVPHNASANAASLALLAIPQGNSANALATSSAAFSHLNMTDLAKSSYSWFSQSNQSNHRHQSVQPAVYANDNSSSSSSRNITAMSISSPNQFNPGSNLKSTSQSVEKTMRHGGMLPKASNQNEFGANQSFSQSGNLLAASTADQAVSYRTGARAQTVNRSDTATAFSQLIETVRDSFVQNPSTDYSQSAETTSQCSATTSQWQSSLAYCDQNQQRQQEPALVQLDSGMSYFNSLPPNGNIGSSVRSSCSRNNSSIHNNNNSYISSVGTNAQPIFPQLPSSSTATAAAVAATSFSTHYNVSMGANANLNAADISQFPSATVTTAAAHVLTSSSRPAAAAASMAPSLAHFPLSNTSMSTAVSSNASSLQFGSGESSAFQSIPSQAQIGTADARKAAGVAAAASSHYHHHLPLAAAQQTLRTQQQMQQPVHQQQQHQSSGSNVRHRNVPDLFPASAHRQQQQQQQQQQPQYFPQQQHQQQHPLSQGPSARPLDVLSHLHNSQQGSTSSHGQGSAASHQHQYGHSNGSTLGSGSNGSNGYHQHANQSYPYYPYGAAQGSNAGVNYNSLQPGQHPWSYQHGAYAAFLQKQPFSQYQQQQLLQLQQSKEQLYQNNQYLQYQQYQPQQKESYYSYQNNSSN